MKLDSAPGKAKLAEYVRNETRFRMVEQMYPKRFAELLARAEREVRNRVIAYEHLAKLAMPAEAAAAASAENEN